MACFDFTCPSKIVPSLVLSNPQIVQIDMPILPNPCNGQLFFSATGGCGAGTAGWVNGRQYFPQNDLQGRQPQVSLVSGFRMQFPNYLPATPYPLPAMCGFGTVQIDLGAVVSGARYWGFDCNSTAFPMAGPPGPAPDAGCASFLTVVSELAYRLGDTNFIHWTSGEMMRYLIEALRVWNGLTASSRARTTFAAVAGQVFYDLPTVLPTLRPYTLHDQDLMLDLQYLLQEPPSAATWTGTAMFNLAELTAVMQRRRDQFLRETRTVAVRELTNPSTPDADGRVALPTDVTTVMRAAWKTGSAPGVVTPLLRDAEWGMNAYKPTWPTPVAGSAVSPLTYSVGVTPPLTLQLAPPPTVAGVLDTVATALGAALNPAAGVLLGVPDDYAWVTKWGTLRDLLSVSGPANDPTRAALAAQLWDLGITAAKASAVLLDARINGTLVRIAAVADADYYQRGWQNSSGAPGVVLTAAPNLIALSPVPDNVTPYTVLVDVVRNQPVPVSLSDCYLEGGITVLSALLDYAEFCARFKEGPAQAEEATQLLQSFLHATTVAIAIDAANQLGTRKPTLDESQRAQTITPMTVAPPAGSAGTN